MLSLRGVLVNTFTSPAFNSKTAQNDDEKPEKPKLQVLGDVFLKNGEMKKELLTVSIPDLSPYEGKEGTEVIIPVGAFSPQKGSIVYFGI